MISLFPRWDMLVPWRVCIFSMFWYAFAINVTIWLGELNCELTIWDVSTWPSNLEDTAKMSKIESILVENSFYQVIQIWT